jgi:uncharacterized phage protein (TIGR02218 family)
MRALPADLSAHLAGGETTLAWCWKLTRPDGVVMGFTDHDRDLEIEGVTYRAGSGFTAGELPAGLGLAVDTMEVEGALSADAITERDIAAGLYDDAEIEILRVNWAEPEQRVVMRRGNLGEISRSGNGFMAEIRSLAHRANQPRGRLYQYGCDAVLGDEACGVDLDSEAFSGEGTVTAVAANRRIEVAGLGAYAGRWFERGRILWQTGANAGREGMVKAHRIEGGAVVMELWQPPAEAIAVGDTFRAFAGCDKQFSTCRGKFGNGINFRGFPHIPGNDFIIAYPSQGDAGLDGGSNHAGD